MCLMSFSWLFQQIIQKSIKIVRILTTAKETTTTATTTRLRLHLQLALMMARRLRLVPSSYLYPEL